MRHFQVEINPFGETPDGEVVCFDAKINFDDAAEYRQKEIFAMGDTLESDPREVFRYLTQPFAIPHS